MPLLLCEVAHLEWSDTREPLASDVFAQRRQLSERDVRVCQLALFLKPQPVCPGSDVSLRVVSMWMPIVVYASGFGAETQRCVMRPAWRSQTSY